MERRQPIPENELAADYRRVCAIDDARQPCRRLALSLSFRWLVMYHLIILHHRRYVISGCILIERAERRGIDDIGGDGDDVSLFHHWR